MPSTPTSSSSLGAYAGAVADLLASQGATAYSYAVIGPNATGRPDIDLSSAAAPSAYTDCSAWVSYALASVAPIHAAVLTSVRTEPTYNNRTVTLDDGSTHSLNEAADWPWARADVLSTAFAAATGANGFTQVTDFGSLTAGDVIAYSTGIYALLADPDTTPNPQGSLPTDTGHTMIVIGDPVEVPVSVWNDGSGSQPADIAKVWAVSVVDSSSLHHFGDVTGFPTPQLDIRDYSSVPSGAPTGSDGGGVGRGTIWFAQDVNGNITHFRFSYGDHWIPNSSPGYDKAILVSAARPTAQIDLSSADLVDGKLQVSIYPNAQDTVSGTTYTIPEQLTGQAGLAVSGAGVLRLTSGNSFVGDVTVADTGTTLSIDGGSALGDDANALTLGNGTVLHFTGAVAFAHPMTLSGNATITLDTGQSSSLSGEVDGTGGSLLDVTGGGTLALDGDLVGINEIRVSQAQTTIALNGSASLGSTVFYLNQGTGLAVSGRISIDRLVADTNATITLTHGATLTVRYGIIQPVGATSLTQINVVGDGTLVLQANGATQMLIQHGQSLYVGTLAELNGASLPTYGLNDKIEVTDLNAKTGGGVIARYDATTGRLVLQTKDGSQSATVTVPPNLTNGSFAVRTDGTGGSFVDLSTPLGTQDATALGVSDARAATGFTGAGITVGVISNSLNALGGLEQDIQNGLLGAGTTALAGYEGTGDDEGREMAQIIHSIAPDATIVFASSNGPGGLAGAITALQNAHVNIIADDIDNFHDNVWTSDTAVDQAVQAAFNANITLLTSAGNTGTNYYERSSFSLSASESHVLGGAPAFDFNLGQGIPNYFQLWKTVPNSYGNVVAVLGWDDPSAHLDMKVFTLVNGLYTPAADVTDVLNASQTARTITLPERTSGNNVTDYYIAITGDLAASGRFKYILHNEGDANVIQDPNANLGSGAISGHALDPAEITVGAVNVASVSSMSGSGLLNETFSSPGASLVDANGNPVTLNLGKPDVSGVDAAPEDVAASSNSFSGTSAAAPSVAGVVALMLQANPNLTPTQVKAVLRASAISTATPLQGGAGLVQAGKALALAAPPRIGSISATADTTGTIGVGHVVTLTLHANTAITVTAAGDGSLPTLTLNDGATATFDVSASSGSDLVFHTTVAGGQSTAGLAVISLTLNGSTLQNGATLQLTGGGLDAVPGAQTALAIGLIPQTLSVFRFFDSMTGTHFYTTSTDERASILASRPDLVAEGQDGVGLLAVNPASGDANAAEVFRFFDTIHGTQFLTISANERDDLIANRPDLTFEPSGSFYEHTQPQQGDVPVYRFFSSTDGTHFYTDNASERATILQTRSDLVAEGIGFYEPAKPGIS